MRLQYRPGGFSKIPQPVGLYLCRPRTFSNLRSSLPRDGDFTHRKPAAILPQNHLVTCRNRRGFNSIFTAESAYGTAGDVSMIDSLEISVYIYLAFRQACTNDKYYDTTAHAQTDPHVSIWRESAFGGNLRVF